LKHTFEAKSFFAIYVRHRRKKPAEMVAVKLLYKKGYLYIQHVLRNEKEIRKRFSKIFRYRTKKPEELVNNQQYFVDEEKQIFISCYTNNLYTPKLIGGKTILQDLE
jgi:hypothetical protein